MITIEIVIMSFISILVFAVICFAICADTAYSPKHTSKHLSVYKYAQAYNHLVGGNNNASS